MAHFVNASELAELCTELGLTAELATLEAATQLAADAIAAKLEVAVTQPANTQPGFAGLCVGFGPAHDGQACPEKLSYYDQGSEWAEGATDV